MPESLQCPNAQSKSALQSHPCYLQLDLGTCCDQCIKETGSLEIFCSCLSFWGRCTAHNQIPAMLEKVLAHLCRCSKEAINSLRDVWAKEAACGNAWNLKSMGQIVACSFVWLCGSAGGLGGAGLRVWVRRIGKDEAEERKGRGQTPGARSLFSPNWQQLELLPRCVSGYTNPHVHVRFLICVFTLVGAGDLAHTGYNWSWSSLAPRWVTNNALTSPWTHHIFN